MMNKKLKKNSVPMILKTFEVLEVFRERPEGISYMELIERFSNISKISLYRILCTLEGLGYLRKDEQTNNYELGAKFIELGRITEKRLDSIRVIVPYMEKILEKYGENVNLAKIESGELIYLKTLEGRHPLRVSEMPNRSTAIYCSGVGKTILAHMPVEEREEIIQIMKLTRLTPNTITSKTMFRQVLEQIVRQGYGLDDEENLVGVRCVAVPVLNRDGNAELGLSVTGPVSRITLNSTREIGQYLATVAREVSTHLYGHMPASMQAAEAL